MGSAPDNGALTHIERLVGELRLIELWDASHRRNHLPEAYEMFAFEARRKRRAEILSQLLTLVPRLDTERSRDIYGSVRGKTRGGQKREPASTEAQVGSRR